MDHPPALPQADAPARVANPFETLPAGVRPASEALATADAEQGRAVAEVQAAIVAAKRCPRDEAAAMRRILAACSRPTLANLAVYQFTRGGDVSGPSIHLAKVLAGAWGNLDFNWRVIQTRPGASLVQAVCWDLETNVRAHRTFLVRHVRQTRGGEVKLTDERDIYETIANAAARRLRACILDIIPADVVEAAVEQVKATQEHALRQEGATLLDRVARMVVAFEALGVDRATLEAYAGRSLDALTPALLNRLAQVCKAIQDGVSSADEVFGAAREKAKAGKKA